MVRKLLCWLGFHEWKYGILCMMATSPNAPQGSPDYEPIYGYRCQHCRKVKK